MTWHGEATQADHDVDIVVIGAGQGGLSSAYYLHRRGMTPETEYVVLDRAPHAGGAAAEELMAYLELPVRTPTQ